MGVTRAAIFLIGEDVDDKSGLEELIGRCGNGVKWHGIVPETNTHQSKRVWIFVGDRAFPGAEQEEECQPY
jgi:hypothetical protein